jgi:hypothetical protein
MPLKLAEDMDLGPRGYIAKYPELLESAKILSEFAGLNPLLFRECIELAMVMAIYAEQKRNKALDSLKGTVLDEKFPRWYGVGLGKEKK